MTEDIRNTCIPWNREDLLLEEIRRLLKSQRMISVERRMQICALKRGIQYLAPRECKALIVVLSTLEGISNEFLT